MTILKTQGEGTMCPNVIMALYNSQDMEKKLDLHQQMDKENLTYFCYTQWSITQPIK